MCPHCKKEIDLMATRCSFCQGKMYVWTKGKKITAIILAVFIFSAFSGIFSDKNTSTKNESAQINEKETQSIVFAENKIENILKSPSTAKFVEVKAYELSNMKDVWAVNGYVDSQNSFGATIRNQWEVQLDYRDGKGGTVKSILLDGKKF